jgi:hypothetical protein
LDITGGQGYPSPAEDGLLNRADTNNVWVTLNPQTGMVSTGEVAAIRDPSQPLAAQLADARRYAREAQRMGGQ